MHRGLKGYQKRRGASAISRSCLLFWSGSERDIHQESLHPPPHPCWPFFPQKPVQRSRASLGRPLWFFSMEPFPGHTVCCRYWCVMARGLSLSPAWVLRPELYLVSMRRHHNSRHQWVQEAGTVLSSLLWGLTLVPGSTQLRHTGQLREMPRVTKTRMLVIPGRPRSPCTKPAVQKEAPHPRWATSWAHGPRGSPAWRSHVLSFP